MAARKYHVTLHLYSGRENPSWIVPGNHEHSGRIEEALRSLPSGGQLKENLGYKGFTIFREDQSGKQEHVVPAGTNANLEELLGKIARAEGLIRDEIVNLLVPVKALHASADVPNPQPGNPTEPAYNPDSWNTNPETKSKNNCYNYANNMITNTFAQPGRASGHPVGPNDFNGQALKRAAESDGLKSVTAGVPVPETTGENHLVALVFSNSIMDFHWYRRAPDGWWSHKPGQTAVIDVDNSGNKINDPRTCDRGPYDEFTGFMTTDPRIVNIE